MDFFRRFMAGRYGSDPLNNALLILGIALIIVARILGWAWMNVFILALLCLCYFRMFSRNTVKRSAENRKYLELRWKWRTGIKQAWVRLKNLRKYKYFKCPECHALLRLPRKVGEVTVTCGKCKHSLKKKA